MREQRLCKGIQQCTQAGAQARLLTWASVAEAELMLIGAGASARALRSLVAACGPRCCEGVSPAVQDAGGLESCCLAELPAVKCLGCAPISLVGPLCAPACMVQVRCLLIATSAATRGRQT